MIKALKKFFTKILTATIAGLLIMSSATSATTNVPFTEVGDYGDWLTPDNLEEFNLSIGSDMTEFQEPFQQNQLVPDYVPIEAKVGLAMMNGLSMVAEVLDSSLVRFAIIFMVLAYILWIMFETYNMMTKGSSAMELGVNIVKKGAVVAIWSIILVQGPAQVFMWIMGPILSVATYMSDLILNAVTNTVGLTLPDTCNAIREYAAANASSGMIIDPKAAADMICVPTRLSGFFTTAIAIGWKWMISGIGISAFTMFVGAAFIVLFIYNAFKFTLMGLGVIMDLFLSVIMLPFTAIAETINKTSYNGIVGDIFNGFLGLFKPESLSNQIQRFINAAIYFVSLSIVIAVCAAMLSGAIRVDLSSEIPSLDNSGFMITFLTGVLVAYLANKTSKIAEDLGGKVNESFSKQFGDDIKHWWNQLYGKGKNIVEMFRDKK